MSSEENTLKENSKDILPGVTGEPIKTKGPSKAVRLLTVIVYILSVSLAAIFLSIYYIFIWKDKTFVSAQPVDLTTSSVIFENFRFNNMDENFKWNESTIFNDIQHQNVKSDLIESTASSLLKEKNSTWLNETYQSSQDDYQSTYILKKLLHNKYPHPKND